ncbi:hypothetical protein EYW49_06850 [Siculibacillus lacustris]|uniref:HPr kinase/phosphorylase C-terminal domain-containing protein n=1 Tax=Siculibacillus lacustris TaxID=1549641 RepID=A0A4Q9VT40_9HYPH|nr:hypothetical protein [Siculibacillus lacustris]TBW39207.1 hypothetical protein EYW49_06850 [Siculibacillus lacustris]
MPDRTVAAAPVTVHATAVVVGADTVLLRGPSGSGKSRIALELIAEAERRGRWAALIGDDRVVLSAVSGHLVARPAPTIAGHVELRGVGILAVPHEPAGVVSLVVDFVSDPPDRLPLPEDTTEFVDGVLLPRLAMWREDRSAVLKVWMALAVAAEARTARPQFVGPFDKDT